MMWFRRIFNRDSSSNPRIKKPLVTQRAESASLHAGIFRQLNQLQIQVPKQVSGSRAGLRSSNQRKPSSEFIEHRSYTPGDDIRYVDWRASARQEGVVIRQGELTKSVHIYLVLDCSGSMGWGFPPKSALQKKLASLLSYLALDQGERLKLLPIGGRGNQMYGPISGKGQYNAVVNYLDKLNYSGEISLGLVSNRIRSSSARGGIVFVLSDMLDLGSFSEWLAKFPTPAWKVNLLHLLHPEELSPKLRGTIEMEDVESREKVNFDLTEKVLIQYQQQISEWRGRLEMECVDHGTSYTLINTGESIAQDLLPLLRSKNLLENR